ncbi:MAG: hypothetical protein MJH11_19575, partial [Lentisphaeria bacterium]|nr:hypothetical protein [Lentisphaeria bacterium]
REIYLISDFQSNQMPDKKLPDTDKNIHYFYLPISGTDENVYVEKVELSTKPKIVNQALFVPYSISNDMSTDSEQPVDLYIKRAIR